MKSMFVIQKEKGQSLVELALVAVFMLILLAGVVDLGRVLFEYLAMRDAAQEGAGYGAIFPNYCAEIHNRVMQNLPDSNYQTTVYEDVPYDADGKPILDAGFLCEVTPDTSACIGKEIFVEIKHNFSITMPFLSTFTGPTVPVRVVIQDRIVRPDCP